MRPQGAWSAGLRGTGRPASSDRPPFSLRGPPRAPVTVRKLENLREAPPGSAPAPPDALCDRPAGLLAGGHDAVFLLYQLSKLGLRAGRVKEDVRYLSGKTTPPISEVNTIESQTGTTFSEPLAGNCRPRSGPPGIGQPVIVLTGDPGALGPGRIRNPRGPAPPGRRGRPPGRPPRTARSGSPRDRRSRGRTRSPSRGPGGPPSRPDSRKRPC